MRACSKCGLEQPITEFYVRVSKDGRRRRIAECKTCCKARTRAANARLADRDVVDIPEWHTCSHCHEVLPGTAFARNRSRAKGIQSICYACHRARRYGLAVGEFDSLLNEQGGVCAICRQACQRGGALSVDHDHVTGRVRGLLCQNCNAALGMMQDDPALLGAAIDYLKMAQNRG